MTDTESRPTDHYPYITAATDGPTMPDKPVGGPASYFPSIEKTYGQPITEWQEIVRRHAPAKHMELVAMLKKEHGMGHGHANAIVAYTLKQDKVA